MGFLIEVFWALLLVGVPIGIFTLALVWWALQSRYFKESLDGNALRREIKAMSGRNKKKTKKEKKERKQEAPSASEKVGQIWRRFLRNRGFFYLYRRGSARNYYDDFEFWRIYRFY